MGPLYGLDTQIQPALLFLYGSVSAVGERARATVAQACDIVFVLAEVLRFCFHLVAAVAVVDHLHKAEMKADPTHSCSAGQTRTRHR